MAHLSKPNRMVDGTRHSPVRVIQGQGLGMRMGHHDNYKSRLTPTPRKIDLSTPRQV